MKKITKITLIIGGILTLLGIICFVIGFTVTGFDIKKFSQEKEFKEVSSEYENYFGEISFKTIDDNIIIKKSEDNKTKVVYYISKDEKIYYDITADKDLSFVQKDDREWYERIAIFQTDKDYSITVYLPEEKYNKLDLFSISGSITSSMPLQLEKGADFNTTSGEINIKNINTMLSVNIGTVSGNIVADACSADKNMKINTVSGDIDIKNTKAFNNIDLHTVSGDINIYKTDSPYIKIDTVSGDIEGSAGKGKFTISTVSGDIQVPSNNENGIKYDLNTVSGDINLTE